MLLEACIGSARVLTRPPARRLWLLDENAAILWDLHKAGTGSTEMVELLVSRFGEEARGYVSQLHEGWLAAGLAGASDQPAGEGGEHAPEPLASFAGPLPVCMGADDWRITVAGRPIILSIENPAWRARLRALFHPEKSGGAEPAPAVMDHVELFGDSSGWTLIVNGRQAAGDSGEGDALLAVVATLTELGCRTAERLMVLHGAGLLAPQGRCLLLAAPGGSGKSTLAMALEAEGFRLLSDDVVPIGQDGLAHGLGLPACIKFGSWSVLSSCRPDLASLHPVSRFGERVHYLPSRFTPFTGAVRPTLLVFPRYRPGAEPKTRRVPPELAFQRIVEADAVIRDLTQEKFTRLCRWVESLAAHELSYPSLHSGIALVHELLEARA